MAWAVLTRLLLALGLTQQAIETITGAADTVLQFISFLLDAMQLAAKIVLWPLSMTFTYLFPESMQNRVTMMIYVIFIVIVFQIFFNWFIPILTSRW